ncbi:MAG: geranylgeranyl reductase family protein [Actinobacteria bacterium]|nr:geranylgeranyl reductase family protein [Actinomycetota bacterium]
MERFDVAVVGAGPAGSTAAYRLARAHARVLLVDKVVFPRDKPCGGGLTMRAVRQLPFPVEPVVEDRITRARCRLRYGSTVEHVSARVLCLMTQRRRLDAFLVEQAAAAGVEFRDGVHVDVEADTALRVDGARIEVEAVIGADGANGTTARSLGLGGAVVNGVALEGNLPYERLPGGQWKGTLVLELGTVPGGYGWIFPKGDHVNVGVGGWGSEGPHLRRHLRILCEHYGIELRELSNVRGHRLPMRRPGNVLARGRGLVVGDAAGALDPVSGDGIYEALVTARLAAEHTLALLAGEIVTLEAYQAAVQQELDPLASAGWAAKIALDRFPWAVFTVMRLPVTWHVIEKLMLGEVAHPGEARGAGRRALQVVEGLARLTRNPRTAAA